MLHDAVRLSDKTSTGKPEYENHTRTTPAVPFLAYRDILLGRCALLRRSRLAGDDLILRVRPPPRRDEMSIFRELLKWTVVAIYSSALTRFRKDRHCIDAAETRRIVLDDYSSSHGLSAPL